MTVLSWFVLQLTGSPLLVSLVGFFASMPTLLIGVVGGLLADSVSRKKIIMWTQAMGFCASASMTILLGLGYEVFWHAYPVLILSGASWAIDMPSRRAAMHDLVGRKGLANAIALDTVGMSASRLSGPITAGFLLAFANFTCAYLVITINYVIAFILTSRVNIVTGGAGRPTITHAWRDIRKGLKYVKASQVLVTTLAITVIMNFLLFPYQIMIPVIAKHVLGIGPALLGVLQASDGLGALFGAVGVASIPIVRRHGWIYFGGSMFALLSLLAFSFSDRFLVSSLLLFGVGIGCAGFSSMQSTLVMLVARDDMKGIVLGVFSVGIGMGLLGALNLGTVANTVSPSFALGLNGVLGGMSLMLVWISMPSLRGRLT